MFDKKVGHYSFVVGILIAIVAGLFPKAISSTALLLVLLGLVVGLLNIRARETTEFLVACIALLVAGGAGLNVITWANVGIYLQAVVANITVFVAPAAVVVSIKAVIELAER